MRYRMEDDNHDMTFGSPHGYLIDSPLAVAEAVRSRLLARKGEWFLDTAYGIPWNELRSYPVDPVLKNWVRDTQGVSSVSDFTYQYNAAERELDISCVIDTIYGKTVYRSRTRA